MSNKQSYIDFYRKQMTSLKFNFIFGQITSEEYDERSKVVFEQTKEMYKKENKTMIMIKKLRLWLASLLTKWAMNICPEGSFKSALYLFVKYNITNLK